MRITIFCSIRKILSSKWLCTVVLSTLTSFTSPIAFGADSKCDAALKLAVKDNDVTQDITFNIMREAERLISSSLELLDRKQILTELLSLVVPRASDLLGGTSFGRISISDPSYIIPTSFAIEIIEKIALNLYDSQEKNLLQTVLAKLKNRDQQLLETDLYDLKRLQAAQDLSGITMSFSFQLEKDFSGTSSSWVLVRNEGKIWMDRSERDEYGSLPADHVGSPEFIVESLGPVADLWGFHFTADKAKLPTINAVRSSIYQFNQVAAKNGIDRILVNFTEVAGQQNPRLYVRNFARDLTLPMSRGGRLAIHDINYHLAMIFLPNPLLLHVQNVAQNYVGFDQFTLALLEKTDGLNEQFKLAVRTALEQGYRKIERDLDFGSGNLVLEVADLYDNTRLEPKQRLNLILDAFYHSQSPEQALDYIVKLKVPYELRKSLGSLDDLTVKALEFLKLSYRSYRKLQAAKKNMGFANRPPAAQYREQLKSRVDQIRSVSWR